jgi:hypothetical protein
MQLNFFSHGMVIKIVLNNEIQIYICVHYWILLFLILSFGQNCNKILKIKNDVLFNVLNEVI